MRGGSSAAPVGPLEPSVSHAAPVHFVIECLLGLTKPIFGGAESPAIVAELPVILVAVFLRGVPIGLLVVVAALIGVYEPIEKALGVNRRGCEECETGKRSE